MTFVNNSIHVVNPIASGPAAAAASAAAAGSDDGISFDDLLDIVNPLQHIPVVGTLYRAITGDTIKTGPKLAGDALYGGVTGFASSMADTIFTGITGKSVGDTVLAFAENLFSPSTAVATSAAPAAPAAASSTAPVGEDLGERILDWIGHAFLSSGAAAATTPATLPAASAQPAAGGALVVPGQGALLTALNRNGVGQDVALRAANAYRQTLNVAGAAAALH